MAQASRPRSRFGLAPPHLAKLCAHAGLAASDAWHRPHALTLALAWLCLASYGGVCMLVSPPFMHGAGLVPSLSPWRGSASPRLLCMHAGLAASDAWPRPHALALALAWLCLASYGCACMLGSLPLMHGSGLTPSPSPRLGSASPRRAGHACKARCLSCMAQASRPRSRLGSVLPRLVWLCMHAGLAASDAWLRPHAARPRSRFGLALPRLVWMCMHAGLAASDAWLRPLALALALAWLCLDAHGYGCTLGSLPLMHGSGLT